MKRVNCLIVAVVCCWLAGCQSPLLIQRTPVVVRDCPGFFVNRVLFRYFHAFNLLLRDGEVVTSPDGGLRVVIGPWLDDDGVRAVTLDTDSFMTANAIMKMVRLAQSDPKLGILQGLVVGLPSHMDGSEHALTRLAVHRCPSSLPQGRAEGRRPVHRASAGRTTPASSHPAPIGPTRAPRPRADSALGGRRRDWASCQVGDEPHPHSSGPSDRF